ncbi:MAG: MDR family MFS transporter [Actinomycetaceae bacterium]|nr:MDR family MFS transporter [Actinomycetaceae bacterium]
MKKVDLAPFDFHAVRWAYFGLLIGMFASAISGTIIGPALPKIVADLGGLEWYSWLSTIVMLVSAVVTPISGKLSDIFGRRRFYILGLGLFMLGSVLSGLAMNFVFLVFARAVQGVGMGILMPLSQTILGDLIPPRQRGKYQGYMGAVMGAAQVAGPLAGGWITDVSSWRWLFYVSIPVGLIAMFIVVRHLHVPELSVPARIDYAGIVTMTLGVTSLLLGISLGGQFGWGQAHVIAMLVSGALMMGAFVFVELRAAEPIVPMYLFKNSIFTFATLAGMFMNMAILAVLIYVPVYAQGVLGVSATISGVILIPMNVVLFLMGVVVGNLTTWTGRYKFLAVTGAGLQVAGALSMLLLGAASEPWLVALTTCILGIGYGMSSQVLVLAVQNAVKRRDLGTATSTLQFFRNIGNTLGTAIAGTIMTTHMMAGIRDGMTPRLLKLVPGGVNPNDVLQPDALRRLPDEVTGILREALAGAMHSVFLVLPVMTVLAFVSTIFVKSLKLRDTFAEGDARGREYLDSTAMSSPDQQRILLTPEDAHSRQKERIMGAHLIILADEANDKNEILRDSVAEFGGGDLEHGKQMLRSTGIMLLSEDPAVIDKHEPFAVELSQRGAMKWMLSRDITERLNDVALRVADQPGGATVRPHVDNAQGIDAKAIRRAAMMLNSTLVADIATHRWLGSV